jgi:hypothetical protein
MNNFLKIATASAILLVSSCSHQQIIPNKRTDHALTCTDISVEMGEVEKVLSEINENTGVSGRNVGMALFFWPGVLVNQMNAGDARKMASERMSVLANLKEKKNCAQEKAKAAPVSNAEVKDAPVLNSEVKSEAK